MWISEQLNQVGSPELPLVGKVTRMQDGKADVESFMPFSALPCAGTFGVDAFPRVGDEVLVLPAAGGYYCAGRILPGNADTVEGEILLRSSGGAYLRLRADGYAEINGLVISPQGTVQE